MAFSCKANSTCTTCRAATAIKGPLIVIYTEPYFQITSHFFVVSLQKKLSAFESFRRRFFTKSNLSMGIGWLVFLLLVFWASKNGGTETQFFDPYEILQVCLSHQHIHRPVHDCVCHECVLQPA